MQKDLKEFEKILKANRLSIMNDIFIREYIDDVLKNIRMQVIVKLVNPYTRIQIESIAKVFFHSTDFLQQLNISSKEVETLLVSLILDGKLSGKIDQIGQVFELDQR